MVKNVLGFYLTVGIPLLYGVVLVMIFLAPENFPVVLGPVMQLLSHPLARSFNLVVALVGIGLWMSSYYYLGRSFGVLPGKKKLVRSGPYKYLNHPMYVGIFLTFTGLALTVLSVPGLLINWLVLTPINIWRAGQEREKLLGE